MSPKAWSARLRRKWEGKGPGYPLATIAFYGPDNRYASKVVVGVKPREEGTISVLERWFADNLDVRRDPGIGREIQEFLRLHRVRSAVMAEGIIGCPHEEGVDYPEGEECPECPFWKGKDRFEHAIPKDE